LIKAIYSMPSLVSGIQFGDFVHHINAAIINVSNATTTAAAAATTTTTTTGE